MKNTFTCTLFALLLVFESAAADHSELLIEDAWIQEGPPNAQVLAGFMRIINPGKQAASFIAASSKQFGSIEFHRTVHADGMARMQPQARLDIGAGSTLRLEHGGYHLMMMQPTRRLKSGDHAQVRFELASGGYILVDMAVRKVDDMPMHHHHH